jgi:UDP-glucose 4-epimerase
MRTLVTGATAYVGWAVVHELCARGHEVRVLAHELTRPFPDGVDVRTGDLLSEASLRDAVDGVDAVCHLAARSRVREAAAHPTRVWRLNVTGTINVLDALAVSAARTGVVPRLVFTSTGAVYGTPTEQPISEQTLLLPVNPYGASKVAAEQIIGWQAATGSLAAVSLRIFNAAGAVAGHADPDPTRIIPKAVAVAAGCEPTVVVNGDGSAVRDFVHVADIARAIALALDAATPGEHRVYNLGAVPASVADVIASVERVTARPVPVEHRPAYAGEAPVLRADTTRIRHELGWTPEHTVIDDLVRDQWIAYSTG